MYAAAPGLFAHTYPNLKLEIGRVKAAVNCVSTALPAASKQRTYTIWSASVGPQFCTLQFSEPAPYAVTSTVPP